MKLTLTTYGVRLRAPFVAAYGEVWERSLVIVALEGDDGVIGYGEAAPLEPYDGVSVDDVLGALGDCERVLRREGDRENLFAMCREVCILPQALAAVDLALWDLEARRVNTPVWRMMGGQYAAAPVAVNATIRAADPDRAAEQAAAAREAGFGCVKVKVGIADDIERVAAVRATAGPEIAIRLDANGAWSPTEAIHNLQALAPMGIELCEEPCSGFEEVTEVWEESDVTIAIDETAAEPGALDDQCADVVCLKIGRCGGITGVVEAAARARGAGYEVYLASTLDGPLGIAAAMHAAAALAPDRPSGLATLGIFDAPDDPMPPHQGRIALPEGTGLGDGLMGWYAGLGAA